MMRDYTRNRSCFWMKIFDNDDSITISANGMVKGLLEGVLPDLPNYSPTGWRESGNYPGLHNLWIPLNYQDRFRMAALEKVDKWATRASSHIWLGTNKNTEDAFYGNEVDYCLAADWNKDFGTGEYTAVGKAEYQLKYNGALTKKEGREYCDTVASAIRDCVKCLPFDLREFIVTAIPATKEGREKLAWRLAECTAGQLGATFMKAKLKKDKPQMKNASIGDKIRIWRDIFEDDDMVKLSEKVKGEDVLIIDDLYQSGASIWCFAEYLKETCGAKRVIAITLVKAQRDGDNQ